MAALFNFIRRANAELDRRGGDRESVERAREAFARINGVLDIVPERAEADAALAYVDRGAARRRGGRRARGAILREADAIRAELTGAAWRSRTRA